MGQQSPFFAAPSPPDDFPWHLAISYILSACWYCWLFPPKPGLPSSLALPVELYLGAQLLALALSLHSVLFWNIRGAVFSLRHVYTRSMDNSCPLTLPRLCCFTSEGKEDIQGKRWGRFHESLNLSQMLPKLQLCLQILCWTLQTGASRTVGQTRKMQHNSWRYGQPGSQWGLRSTDMVHGENMGGLGKRRKVSLSWMLCEEPA